MNFSLFDYLCCSKPSPLVTFQHTRVELTSTAAYLDLFCYLERTVIMDQDYLSVTHNFTKSSNKIPIMRDIGNTSGVARVTLSNEPGMYTINYIRKEGKKDLILGQITIPVLSSREAQSTFDTENYSPKFLNTYQSHFNIFAPKLFEKTWHAKVESADLSSSNKSSVRKSQ